MDVPQLTIYLNSLKRMKYAFRKAYKLFVVLISLEYIPPNVISQSPNPYRGANKQSPEALTLVPKYSKGLGFGAHPN